MAESLIEVVPPKTPDSPPAIVVHARLRAAAGRAELTGIGPSAFTVRVAAPPASAAANRAVSGVLAELFGVAPEAVEVIAGEGHPEKQLQVTGIDQTEADRLVEVARHHLAATPGGGARTQRGR
jgi:uncharacterized protein YggU (UPF0235/DUF167 family)